MNALILKLAKFYSLVLKHFTECCQWHCSCFKRFTVLWRSAISRLNELKVKVRKLTIFRSLKSWYVWCQFLESGNGILQGSFLKVFLRQRIRIFDFFFCHGLMLGGFATLWREICGGVFIMLYHRVLLFPYSLGIASFMHLHALIKFELSSICDKAFGKFFFNYAATRQASLTLLFCEQTSKRNDQSKPIKCHRFQKTVVLRNYAYPWG